jgi:hypothetical protein
MNYGLLPISVIWLLVIGQWRILAYWLAILLCLFLVAGIAGRLGLWTRLSVSPDDPDGPKVYLTMIARSLVIAGFSVFIFEIFADQAVGSARLPTLYLSYQIAMAPWPNLLTNRPAVLLLMVVQFSYLAAIGAFVFGALSLAQIGMAFCLLFPIISLIGAKQHFTEQREMRDFLASIEAPVDDMPQA